MHLILTCCWVRSGKCNKNTQQLQAAGKVKLFLSNRPLSTLMLDSSVSHFHQKKILNSKMLSKNLFELKLQCCFCMQEDTVTGILKSSGCPRPNINAGLTLPEVKMLNTLLLGTKHRNSARTARKFEDLTCFTSSCSQEFLAHLSC